MTEFIKMDVFFLVTTIVTIIIALFLSFILYYLIRLLKKFTRIAQSIEEEVRFIRADINLTRDTIKKEGVSALGIFSLFSKKVFKNSRKNKKAEVE
jgi:hypothetical protein